MARSVSFDNGLGLSVHARTEIVTDWSLIKNAAVRIGDSDTFELGNDGNYYYNGAKNVDVETIQMANKYTITKQVVMKEVMNEGIVTTEPKTFVTIDLGNQKSIKMQLWRHMISVQVNVDLDDTEGMLGMFDKKGLIGRDRETVAIDANDMGYQWQVQDTEPMLFHEIQIPQFPQQCILPSVDTRQRRLNSVSDDFFQSAEEACMFVESDLRTFCMNDVILTRDIHVAQGYGDNTGFSY